ncbi:unnamed protein product [Nippostrongylus brasiliensis]|uniref:Uncharacterized protein n=1 Tax=Nippostrongylus brasiliensis TaxID=27835 RepID=A0A0N4XCM8_NIPBR|nr:unnamed protein product [Nippostrongylus brasiliensis]
MRWRSDGSDKSKVLRDVEDYTRLICIRKLMLRVF